MSIFPLEAQLSFLKLFVCFALATKNKKEKKKTLYFVFLYYPFVTILIHYLRPYRFKMFNTFILYRLMIGPRLPHSNMGRRLLLPTGNSFHNPLITPFYSTATPSSHLADAFTLLLFGCFPLFSVWSLSSFLVVDQPRDWFWPRESHRQIIHFKT